MGNSIALDVLNYIMLFGLLPISFFWLRRAFKIAIKKDYSFVALKRGVPPDNPKKYAPFSLAINLIAGLVLAGLFIYILVSGLVEYFDKFSTAEIASSKLHFILALSLYGSKASSNIYQTWTSIVGSTIWLKLIFDFILSRQAHLNMKKKGK